MDLPIKQQMEDERIKGFIHTTGASRDEARSFLEKHAWNLEVIALSLVAVFVCWPFFLILRHGYPLGVALKERLFR